MIELRVSLARSPSPSKTPDGSTLAGLGILGLSLLAPVAGRWLRQRGADRYLEMFDMDRDAQLVDQRLAFLEDDVAALKRVIVDLAKRTGSRDDGNASDAPNAPPVADDKTEPSQAGTTPSYRDLGGHVGRSAHHPRQTATRDMPTGNADFGVPKFRL